MQGDVLRATALSEIESEADDRRIGLGLDRHAGRRDRRRKIDRERLAVTTCEAAAGIRSYLRDVVEENGETVAEGLEVAAALDAKLEGLAVRHAGEEVGLELERSGPAVGDVEGACDVAGPFALRA